MACAAYNGNASFEALLSRPNFYQPGPCDAANEIYELEAWSCRTVLHLSTQIQAVETNVSGISKLRGVHAAHKVVLTPA